MLSLVHTNTLQPEKKYELLDEIVVDEYLNTLEGSVREIEVLKK